MGATQIPDLMLLVWKRWRSESPVSQGLVTQEQYWVLRTLSLAGPLKLKDLAGRLGCTPSTASIAVKRLEKAGLLTRTRAREDERVVRVALTGKGNLRLQAWRRDQLARIGGIFDRLTGSERDQLQSLLQKALADDQSLLAGVSGGGRRG